MASGEVAPATAGAVDPGGGVVGGGGVVAVGAVLAPIPIRIGGARGERVGRVGRRGGRLGFREGLRRRVGPVAWPAVAWWAEAQGAGGSFLLFLLSVLFLFLLVILNFLL